MAHYIKSLIEQGEHQKLDFKFEISDARKIAKTFSAFANTDGGKLLIGVKDNGVITGIRADEEDYMVESAAHLFCRPKIDYHIKKWFIDGKWVLEVTIPESKSKPHYAKNEDGRWLAYLRVKDENLLANSVMLNVWKLGSKSKGILIKYGPKEKRVMKVLLENATMDIDQLTDSTGIKKYIIKNILVKMISVGVVEIVYRDHRQFYRLKKMPEPIG